MEIDKHKHALRRRFLAPAFSDKALKEAEKLIAVSALKLANGLGEGGESGWSAAKNMNDWTTWFGFDFISNLGYGSSFGMLDGEDSRWIPGVLKSASRFIYYFGYLPFIDLVRPLMGTAIQSLVSQNAADSLRYTEMANSRLAKRIEVDAKRKMNQQELERKDTFHYLLNSKDSVTGKNLSKEELQADSALIIAAGSDGVGITIAACMFYLLNYPQAMARLVKEIRESFNNVKEIRNPKLATLPYLQACIEETLRLNPPKPSTLPREVLDGGLTIDGKFFPRGVNIGSPLYVMHHDCSIFPEPWSFKPERFIASESGADNVAAARAVSAPFLIGPMNCIGKNMSFIALKLAITNILFSNDVRISGRLTGGGGRGKGEGRQREDEYQMQDWIIAFRDGPMVEIQKRGSEEKLAEMI